MILAGASLPEQGRGRSLHALIATLLAGSYVRAVAIIDVPMIEIIDGMVSMGWAFGV